MQKLTLFFLVLIVVSCSKKEQADLIVTNANIYTVNNNFETAQAFAVKNGKFLEVGSSKDILAKYESSNTVDANGQTILPGFIDAHAHFMGLGFTKQTVNLVGTKSFDEVVDRVIEFQNKNNLKYVKGRGWDQNDWEDKEFPNNNLLNVLYPDIPIVLTRIDGHASLVNQAALDLGKVNANSKINGGDVILNEGKPTGVLIDRAQGLVLQHWPDSSRKDNIRALLDAQEECFKYGLTTIDDAGVGRYTIELMDSLHKTGDLKIRIYAMAAGSKENLDYYLNRGIIKTDRLNVRSFKISADGALGSRGALLREPYSDMQTTYGLPVTSLEYFNEAAKRIADSEYQLNTHAIGDSANHAVLQTYKKVLQGKPNRRWRVEHAQIVSPEDFELFNDIVPSVQPTHATSDMYWAEDRVGSERMKGAYAFKDLLNKYGKVALGTDFPVEQVSPFLTFYAAVARQDVKGYPEGGFQMENALSREETLKGMTIWAAYSNFEENEKGSIETGKFADFIILDKDIMQVPLKAIPNIKVIQTYVDGVSQ
jgi:predicted amidohydrolase YtcJ